MQASSSQDGRRANTMARLRRHAALAACCAALSFATSHASQALAGPKGKVHKVVIEAMQYSPAVIEAAPGDTVVWTNKDPFPHTVTSSGAQSHGFDSGDIAPDRSWKLT